MSNATESPRRATLTIPEVAAEIGVSSWTAYQQAKSGSIAGVRVLRVGRRLLVPRAALERVLAGETVGTAG